MYELSEVISKAYEHGKKNSDNLIIELLEENAVLQSQLHEQAQLIADYLRKIQELEGEA